MFGLVVEGGGMRGIYAAGVLDVLMEEDLPVDALIGVSAGAIMGCSYISHQKGRSIRYYKKYCKDKRFMGFRSLLKTGNIVGNEFCYHELPEKLDVYDYNTFNTSKIKFYATCCNVETGNAEYLEITDMQKEIDIMRASASLPYFSKIVDYKGKKYLDGGCADSIPVEKLREMGYKCIVILTRDASYVKKPHNKLFPKLFYGKYPEFCKALIERHNMYNATISKINDLEKSGEIFVIRPSQKLTIGRLSRKPDEIQKVYDIGCKDIKNRIGELKDWIHKNANE